MQPAVSQKNATPAKLDQLHIAERCSTLVLQLLEAYSSTNQRPTPDISRNDTTIPVAGMMVPKASDLDLPPIPANEFEKFEQLMRTGQLLMIEAWSNDLGEIFPELCQVADILGFYANSADLPSLQTVLDRWRQKLA